MARMVEEQKAIFYIEKIDNSWQFEELSYYIGLSGDKITIDDKQLKEFAKSLKNDENIKKIRMKIGDELTGFDR